MLARDADPADDPVLVLRVAEAAARAGLPIAPNTLARLGADCPAAGPVAAVGARRLRRPARRRTRRRRGLRGPRPGRPAGPAAARSGSRAQQAAAQQLPPLHRRPAPRRGGRRGGRADPPGRRPDLLLLGALLHDIGKGLPGDHTEAGHAGRRRDGSSAGHATRRRRRLVAMVRHHLLLPGRRDPPRPRRPGDRPGGRRRRRVGRGAGAAARAHRGRLRGDRAGGLEQLEGQLVGELVRRTRALLAGAPLPRSRRR